MLLWEYFVIFVLCLIGSSYTSYRIGHERGVQNALTYLEEEGILEFTDE